jgi:uncharacterized protein YbjT (DUF2867 family)
MPKNRLEAFSDRVIAILITIMPWRFPMIVITTPTGQIGRQVLGNLLESGEQLRVIARDPSQLPAEVREDLDIVEGSHGDAAVMDKAFAGADAVFWLTPPDPRAPSVEAAFAGFTRPAAEAFTRHGVGRVVGVSMLGRGTPWAGQAGFVTARWRWTTSSRPARWLTARRIDHAATGLVWESQRGRRYRTTRRRRGSRAPRTDRAAASA